MREALEKTILELWSGPDKTPDIIISLEGQGFKVTEKRVLDTALNLELEGSDIQPQLFKDPSLIDGWWREFEAREEKSALELIGADNVKRLKSVGRARHIAGCYLADELNEKGHKPGKITATLKKRGFHNHEIDKIKKEVGI